MTACWRRASGLLAVALVYAPASATVLTGAVVSSRAQPIIVPMENASPTVLRFFAPDGTRVRKGDPVLSVDADSERKQLQTLRDKIAVARATAARDLSQLQLKGIDAQLASVAADAGRDKAALDAAIPRAVIMGLDYDRYQGAYRKARLEAAQAARELAAARAAVTRQKRDGALQVKKLQDQLQEARTDVDHAVVRASQDGMVIHGFKGENAPGGGTGQYEEGSSAYVGSRVGSVVVGGDFHVRAWALAPDRHGLHKTQAVLLGFDALPGHSLRGHIRSISASASRHPGWGRGVYYRVDIDLPPAADHLPLASGMSVRVDTRLGDTPAPGGGAHAPIHAEGSVIARRSSAVSPPAIPMMWMMHITQMADDGARVKKGQVVVRFAAGNLKQALPSKLGDLAEKKREQKQLRLKLADDARTARLATAKAQADARKARRKAQAPPGVVPALQYRKLLIDRHAAERTLLLTRRRQALAARNRRAQQALADLQVRQLQNDVHALKQSLTRLALHAPASGVFMHAVSWQGDKVDTGSQVFVGQSVARIPDLGSLGVHAALPERDLQQVHVGEKVSVALAGSSSRILAGHITGIGHTVHSTSRVKALPVVDLYVDLDDDTHGLRPGQPVRVSLAPGKAPAS